MKRLHWILAIALVSSGCIPVLIGGAIASSASSNAQQQDFIAAFQSTNTERETAGLVLLDWCSECYRFNRGWAMTYEGCRDRINLYEKGDTTALVWPAG